MTLEQNIQIETSANIYLTILLTNLEILTNQLNIVFFYKRLTFFFVDYSSSYTAPSGPPAVYNAPSSSGHGYESHYENPYDQHNGENFY